ncbi:MAG: FliH/SctL family protein [Lachnospiraceae bacterium]
MSSNLLKGGYVIIANKEAVKIDSNQTIAKRLEELSLQKIQEQAPEEVGEEGFTEGIDPFQVAQLVGDEVIPAPGSPEASMRDEILMQETEIVNAAKEDAQKIIDDANLKAKEIQEQAQENGHKEGFDLGYREGLDAANEEIKKQEKMLQNRFAGLEQELKDNYEVLQANMESELVHVLTQVYSHVLGIELSSHNELILFLLKRALADVGAGKNYVIHVSKADIALVQEEITELAALVGVPEENISIVEDNSLSENGCLIESETGIFDCGLDTQLSLLKKQLRMLSFQKED